MKRYLFAVAVALTTTTAAWASSPNASQILEQTLNADPFGLNSAHITARLLLRDKRGTARELAFVSKALRYDPPYAKSLVRFSAPPDLAGAGFLQIQKRDGDDERMLYLPDLKRARRIAGTSRSSAFMGTDLTYADLDQRDFRGAQATLKGEENVGKWPCHVLDMIPRTPEGGYSHIEMWIRQDNAMPMRMRMYDLQKSLLKTFEAQEVRRVDGRWFVSKSRMTNNQTGHTTELVLERIESTRFADEDFTVRALEKQ